MHFSHSANAASVFISLLAAAAPAQLRFADATAGAGLEESDGPISAGHVAAADLDSDGYDDLIVGRSRIFLNRATEDGSGRIFVEVLQTGLPELGRGDVMVFADIDGDGVPDAIVARYLDVHSERFVAPEEGTPQRVAWLKGNGDGTFGEPLGAFHEIEAARGGTACSIAVGDLDLDGRLDIVVGHWYEHYGQSFAGMPSDVLLQRVGDNSEITFERVPWPTDGIEFDPESDAGGRPTYGVMIVDLMGDAASGNHPQILELNYGRRWNRLWVLGEDGAWRDVAPEVGLDGDEIRHGRHPEWLKERARTDARFDRADERPFRANGNTFDASIGDITGDGRFDILLTEITHGWAGESSDPTRVLVREDSPEGPVFVERASLSLDRSPRDPTVHSWNQGDIYGELADFDLDGRVDVLVCSSDYPDNQRLRIWRQQDDGSLEDVTSWIGIDHIGAGQPALLDFNADGRPDIAVGQSFNRLNATQRAGRTPRLRLFENATAHSPDRRALTLRLEGDVERGVNRPAIGAVVRVTAEIEGLRVTQTRMIVGPGGHQGKQRTLELHFALGGSPAERVEIRWPDAAGSVTVFEDLDAGRYTIGFGMSRPVER